MGAAVPGLLASDGGGLDSVHTDDTLTGSGTSADPLGVGNPFTEADESKLDGVEPGAQANPKHIIRFSAQDSDVVPASSLDSGELGIYEGSAQIQSGDISRADTIYIPRRAASFGADPTDPGTDLAAYGTPGLLGFLLANPGASVILSVTQRGTANTVWFQADQVAAYGTAGYVLSSITHLKGAQTITGSGYGWNVVIGITTPIGVKDIIDAMQKLVFRAELEGSETDLYSSYTNGFIASGYRRGSMCLFTDSDGPPTNANAVRQPDIADQASNGVFAFGQLRVDKDPNKLAWGPALAAGQFANGQVLYVSVASYKQAHVKVTLTSAGTLVGTGDAAYVWHTATWDEVDEIPDVVDYGNYFLIAAEEPSHLDLRIPATDVLDPPWVRTDGSNIGDAVRDAVQGDNEDVELAGDFRVDTTGVARYVQFSQSGDDLVVSIRIPNADIQNKGDLERLLQPAAWVEIGDYVVDITSEYTLATIGASVTFTSNYVVVEGTLPTGSATRKVRVVGADVHRGQLARPAFKGETPSIAGRGGSKGKIWGYVSSVANATWVAIVATLLDAIQGTRTSADRGKLLMVKSDDENALELVSSSPVWTRLTAIGYETGNGASWTDILTGLADDDIIHIGGQFTAGGDERALSGVVRFGSLPTDRLWVPGFPDSGYRVQFRRNGTSLQAQTGGASGHVSNVDLLVRTG